MRHVSGMYLTFEAASSREGNIIVGFFLGSSLVFLVGFGTCGFHNSTLFSLECLFNSFHDLNSSNLCAYVVIEYGHLILKITKNSVAVNFKLQFLILEMTSFHCPVLLWICPHTVSLGL
uniref:Uncharacterized protein n=1 Tax=Opuntia streptacantha TaxID=393608 RepID=A0A7C9EA00_OPUST